MPDSGERSYFIFDFIKAAFEGLYRGTCIGALQNPGNLFQWYSQLTQNYNLTQTRYGFGIIYTVSKIFFTCRHKQPDLLIIPERPRRDCKLL